MSKKDIVKEVNDFSVDIADNGFVLNYSGRNNDDDWTSAKLVFTEVGQLVAKIYEIIEQH